MKGAYDNMKDLFRRCVVSQKKFYKNIGIMVLSMLLLSILSSTVYASWVPSPETWIADPDKWFMNIGDSSSSAVIDSSVHHGTTGTRSAKMNGNAYSGIYVILDKPWTGLAAATNYSFTVWYKASGGYTGTPKIIITYLSRWANPLPDLAGSQQTIQGVTGDHDWAQISNTLSIPTGTAKIIFKVVSETAQGTVWFDDVNIYKTDTPTIDLVQNSSFETLHQYMSDSTFFSKLNLDYPGLEQVKADVQQSNYELAKTDFLTYYKSRTAPLQLGDRNGGRPTQDPNYETYLADLVKNHTLSEFGNGERYTIGTDIDWTAFAPDGSNSTLAVQNYFPIASMKRSTKLMLNFDKNSGTVAGDVSGYANHGTINGTPLWTNGKYDYGLITNANTYVSVPDSNSLDITDDLTVQGWFKWDGTTYDGYGVHKGDAYGIKVVNSQGYPTALVYVDGQWREAVSPDPLPNDDQWHHIAMTYSSLAKELNLYVDNVLKMTTVLSELSTYQINSSNYGISIGRNSQSATNIFVGDVDYISIADTISDSFNITAIPGLNPGLMANAYWYTGDETYADETLDWMLDWIRDNPYREDEYISDPDYATQSIISAVEHPAWQSLTEAIRLQDWIWLLNSIRDSNALTANKFVMLMKSMYEHANDIRTRHENETNAAVTEIGALFQFSALFPEFQDSSGWKSYATGMLSDIMKIVVYPDGTEYELSTMYHLAVLNYFTNFYNLKELNHWSFPDSYTMGLEKMYEYLMYVCKPNKTLPMLSDATLLRIRATLDVGADLFNRSDMKYVATNGAVGVAPTYTSYDFPYAGQYVMRSGWESDANYLLMDAGPLGVSHYHEDKLTFDLTGYGKNFIVDPGLYLYGNYLSRTRSHNTVMIDNLEQNRTSVPSTLSVTAPLTDTAWVSGTGFDYASGKYENGYGPTLDTSANQKRIVFFAKPDYWIVRDIINGTGTHKVEEKFQFAPMDTTINPTAKIVQTSNTSEPNLRIIPVDTDGLEVSYAQGQESTAPGSEFTTDTNTKLLLHLNEGSGTNIADSSGIGNNGTLTGTPGWIQGKFGNALSFNSNTQYGNIPDNNSLDITNNITVESWVYWDGSKSGYVINKRYAYGLQINSSGFPTAVLWMNGVSQVQVVSAYTAIAKNQWTHIAFTYSSSTRQLRLYINGSEVRVYVFSNLSNYELGVSTDPLRIANDLYANNFPGYVDEVRISDVVRDYHQSDGWYSEVYSQKVAAPQVSYIKTGITLPSSLDFVFYPTQSGQNPTINVTRINVTVNNSPVSTDLCSAMSICKPDGTDYIAISEEDTGDKAFNNYHSDAELAYIRQNTQGNITSMSIMHGTMLKDTYLGNDLITVISPKAADKVTVTYQGSTLQIDTSLDLSGTECIRIYAPSISNVQVNGQSTGFQTIGNYVVVGEAANITDSNTALLIHVDDGQGTSVGDSSGNSNNGTLQGTAYWSASKFGNAISTNGGNGYIRVEDNNSLDITDELTVEGWFKCNGTQCKGYLVQKGYAYGLKVGDTNNNPCGLVYVDGAFRSIVLHEPLTPGVWYHLAMTYSSTTKTINLYVNGVLKASTTLSGLSTYKINTDNNWVAIGRDSMGWGGVNNILDGYIDEVRISNSVRSEFLGNKPYLTDSNTALLIHIDDGQGTGSVDSSGNSNNGTLQSTVYWSTSKFGNAISTNGGNGYIRVEDSNSLDITDELTVEGWFKCNGTQCKGYLVHKGYTYGLKVGDTNNNPCGTVYVDGAFRSVVLHEPLTPGVWYHLAMTYSSTTKTINLYVNGVLKASTTLSGLSTYKINTDNNWVAIGRDSMGWGGVNNILDGYIDEVRVSNSVRTSFPLVRNN